MVIWAGGKINQVNFNLNPLPENGKSGSALSIPFRCNVKTKVAETLRFENKVFETEFTAKAIRQVVTSPDGNTLIFTNAAGFLLQKTAGQTAN